MKQTNVANIRHRLRLPTSESHAY